jgi:hypothetical protein
VFSQLLFLYGIFGKQPPAFFSWEKHGKRGGEGPKKWEKKVPVGSESKIEIERRENRCYLDAM